MTDDFADEVIEEAVEPEAPPTEEATEEPAQEVEEISPNWLDEPVSEQPSAQHGYTPEQVAAYQYQMQQMQQMQQPQQQQRGPDDYLNEFVRDPNGYMSNVARQEAQSIAQQMMQQGIAPVQQQMNAFFNAQVEMQADGAKRSINDMYKSFSKDEAFRGNKQVKEQMDRTLQGLYYEARQQASMGNPRALMMFSQPGFADVALAAVKAQLGVRGGSSAPASVPHVESTTPSAAGQSSRALSPDEEAAVERLGPGGRERYLKSLDELDKFGDFEG
jgi:hypothetical protein